jgi:CHAT domain-containing protein
LIDAGDYEGAGTCIDEALAIRMEVLGELHLDTAVSLNNQGLLLHHSGDLAAARDIYERCLEINRKVSGEQHSATSNSLHNLGSVYWAWGNHQAALGYLQQAVVVRRAVFGEQHSRTAVSLNMLGLLLHDMGDYTAALKQHEQALAIRRNVFGSRHAETARSLSSLAGTFRSMGKPEAAREHYEQALEIQKSTVGVRHRDTAASLNGLAGVLHDLGDYAAAQEHYEQSVGIYRAAVGDRHFRTAGALMRLGHLLQARGDLTGAAARFNEARRIIRQYVAGVLPGLSQAEQLQFLNQTDADSLHRSLSLGPLHREDGTIAELSAGWLLNGKAVAHEALAQRALLARALTDPAAASLVEQLESVRGELARSSLKPVKPEEHEAHRARLQQLQAEVDRLTRQLTTVEAPAPSSTRWVELRDVRSRIPAGAVLIDVVRFRPFDVHTTRRQDRWKAARYAAWIIPPTGVGNIRIVDLGEADAVEAAVKRVRTGLEQAPQQIRTNGEPAAEQALRQSLTKLSQLVLQPLLAEAGYTKQLILSPDALLWLVPWSALPVGEERYAIEDYEISFVVSGRDLVTQRKPLKSQPPLILADPDFGPVRQATPAEQRGGRSLASLPSVQRLPGTAAEAQAIRPRVEQYTGRTPELKTGSDASEAAFRNVQQPEVLTLSTHGFFLPDQKAIQTDEAQEPGDDTRRVAVTADGSPLQNPLLRCGLLLAGCNQRFTAGADDDDGVLTGLEIVSTDLRGTKLVVLSACETGLGDVRNGEGVAGLRQAFQLAGAESVVATLWQVPDRDTARLMVEFFEQLAEGKSRSEALREAQLARIRSHRDRYGAAHPFFWAAVTLTGRYD